MIADISVSVGKIICVDISHIIIIRIIIIIVYISVRYEKKEGGSLAKEEIVLVPNRRTTML